jgi:hypothetical protein
MAQIDIFFFLIADELLELPWMAEMLLICFSFSTKPISEARLSPLGCALSLEKDFDSPRACELSIVL